MNIGDKIKQYRTEIRLSQDDLAKEAKVSRGAIMNYESNRRIPPADVAYRIAAVLKVSVDELLNPDVPKTYDEELDFWGARQRIHKEKLAYALIETKNPAINRDSPVGKVVYKIEFQWFIMTLLELLIERSGDEKKAKEWEIIQFLNDSLKHLIKPEFDSEDVQKILSVFDWFILAMASQDEEAHKVMTNYVRTTLKEKQEKRAKTQS
jgi:transcriptional regulator with XRE-family HTH domain